MDLPFYTYSRMRWFKVRSFVTCVSIHEMIWFAYSVVIINSPEDRTTAKVILLIVFVYLASVISFIIGRTKRFVFLSLVMSALCFLFIKVFLHFVVGDIGVVLLK